MMRFELYRRMFADLGTPILPTMKVMDFGCGEGKLVSAALKQGFDAYGCDLFDIEYSYSWGSKEIADRLKEEGRLRKIRSPYELPFEDASIDVVVSDQVLEHIQNYPQMIAELSRILRPGGFFLHAFPSRSRPIEAHIYVPWSSIFRPRWWLWLWAAVGLRNAFQKGLPAREVVEQNAHFLAHGTNYLPPREIKREFRKCFSQVAFVEHAFLPHSERPKFLAKVPLGATLYALLSGRFLYGVRPG
jgi:SAM-dependent methyltransferase